MAIATIGPLAYEFFSGMQGTYEGTREFMERYKERIRELGPAPASWDRIDAIEWAEDLGYLRVGDDKVVLEITGPKPVY
jgi:hypothetical protein